MEAKQNISTEWDRADGNRAVPRRFSISGLFERQVRGHVNTQLYVEHIEAISEEEALRCFLFSVQEDSHMAGYSIALSVVKDF